MGRWQKFYFRILTAADDNNINFRELCGFLKRIGFIERIKGNHHIFYREGVEEIINLQPNGKSAKGYQVKQVREIIIKYKMGVNANV